MNATVSPFHRPGPFMLPAGPAGAVRLATAYVALLNHRAGIAALGEAVDRPPYKAPPKAPVLGIKPRNCFVGQGEAIVVPAGVDELQMAPTLGIVIGRTARGVSESAAWDFIAGYTVCNDVSLPHPSHYRPAMRWRCRDTFLPVGPLLTATARVRQPDALEMIMSVDGREVFRASTGGMQRPTARLLAEVSAFMTLAAGDLLMLGTPHGAPRARVGQRVAIAIDGLGSLSNPLRAEGTA